MTSWLNRVCIAVERNRFRFVRKFRHMLYGADVHRYKHALAASTWKRKFYSENRLFSNSHYAAVYTTLFGLDKSFYSGKKILDIGCGPRGSLEWADNALEAVGLDPLVPVYRKLGIAKHRMTYVASGSEQIPFQDGHFSVVTAINSLDHVDNIESSIAEIKRVTAPGGSVLISVEIDHPPCDTEPTTVTKEGLLSAFQDFTVAYIRVYALSPGEWTNNVVRLMARPERPAGASTLGGLILHLVKNM